MKKYFHNPNKIFAFSKKVVDENINSTIIENLSEIRKIEKVIENLPKGDVKRLEELDLDTNPKMWIRSLLEGYPNNIEKRDMISLMNDFTDAMKTRMREERKYVIGLLSKNQLLLCHSTSGEETITPEWKAIPRMLDSDNILRYVQFIVKKDRSIEVRFFERYKTVSFVDWLGLSERESFYYLGGKYRIYSEIDNKIIVFELNDEELEEWLEEHPEIINGRIEFPQPIKFLNIKHVMVGKRKYSDVGDFLQDFHAEMYGIDIYKKHFEKIVGSMDPYIGRVFDEKDKVTLIKGDSKRVLAQKRNQNLDILFVSKDIELRNSYLEDLFKRFINGEKINIYHAGQKFSLKPLEIGSMNIFNHIEKTSLTEKIIDFYKKTNLQDYSLRVIIEFLIFELLSMDNKGKHIYYFFKSFSRRFLREIRLSGILTTHESEILEFKSQEYFLGRDNEIIEKLSNDLSKKLKRFPIKIYLIGVEDYGTLNPLPKNRITNDRIEKIKNELEKRLNKNICIIPIVSEIDAIILLIAGDKNG